MTKSSEAFRTIREVAEWLDTPTHVLRFWETRFSQIKPVKRAGGRRYYRPADMLLIGGIRRLLHEDGVTIKGVQKIINKRGIKHVQSLSPPLDTGGAPVEAPAGGAPERVAPTTPTASTAAGKDGDTGGADHSSAAGRVPEEETTSAPAPMGVAPAPESGALNALPVDAPGYTGSGAMDPVADAPAPGTTDNVMPLPVSGTDDAKAPDQGPPVASSAEQETNAPLQVPLSPDRRQRIAALYQRLQSLRDRVAETVE